jgi:hypothetical protein
MNGKTVTTHWKRGSRNVTPGTEVSIRGERGRFRFRQHVRLEDGREWIDVIGERGFRSFRPEAIRVVHIKRKTRPVSARAARLMAVAA